MSHSDHFTAMHYWPKWIHPVVFALLLAIPAFAKKEDPLERMRPVPANVPIPVIDFFRPARFRNPQLNPGGTHFLAIVSSQNDRNDVLVYDFEAKKFKQLTGDGDLDVYSAWWLDDRNFIFNASKDKKFAHGLFVAEVAHLRRATPLVRYDVAHVISVPQAEPLRPIIWITQSYRSGMVGVKQISTDAVIVRLFPKMNGGDAVEYLPDKHGQLAFGVTAKDGILTLQRLAGSKWEKSPSDLDAIDLITGSENPDELYVLGPRTGAHHSRPLQCLDSLTGKLGEIIYQDDDYDLTGLSLVRHEGDRRLLGLRYHQRLPKTVWFDPAYQAIQAGLEKALPDLSIRILGSDRAQQHFFVAAESDRVPACYYYFDLTKGGLTPIASTAPWIDPQRQQPMQGLSYKTRDGASLDGYVTLPAGASKENPAPLVVLPHGGPLTRDTWGWDPEVQFLASRGYAVFQPNYRGSTGYGCRFPKEDEWAFRKMHDDVTDGVQTLIRTGLVDAKRIAIMGTSFGGYLALCGAAYEPELYRCAITIAGVFDWAKVMKKESRWGHTAEYGVLRRHLGDPKADQEKFDEISPLRHVDQIKIPIYVAHGSWDTVADVAESKSLIAELKKYGVPYEKQIAGDETHGFFHLDNKVKLYTNIEAFLAKYMPPNPTAPAPAP